MDGLKHCHHKPHNVIFPTIHKNKAVNDDLVFFKK